MTEDEERYRADGTASTWWGGGAVTRARPRASPVERQLRALVDDADRDRQLRAVAAVLAGLERLDCFERTALVASWAAGSSPRLRLAIARALRFARPTVADHAAMEHLAGDPDPLVRLAIAQAAWLRRGEAPARFTAILRRLAGDPDLTVRTMAELMAAMPRRRGGGG